MKLVRIGPAGQEQPAVLARDGAVLDLKETCLVTR